MTPLLYITAAEKASLCWWWYAVALIRQNQQSGGVHGFFLCECIFPFELINNYCAAIVRHVASRPDIKLLLITCRATAVWASRGKCECDQSRADRSADLTDTVASSTLFCMDWPFRMAFTIISTYMAIACCAHSACDQAIKSDQAIKKCFASARSRCRWSIVSTQIAGTFLHHASCICAADFHDRIFYISWRSVDILGILGFVYTKFLALDCDKTGAWYACFDSFHTHTTFRVEALGHARAYMYMHSHRMCVQEPTYRIIWSIFIYM